MTMARNSRTLVIGGLGFIGVNLTSALVDAGDACTILTPSRERHVEGAARFEAMGVRIVEGDVRNRELMVHLVRDQDAIVNLAGQSGAERSMEDPWTDLDVNCRGNLVLLEAVRDVNPAARIVYVGSRLQYGRVCAQPVAEDAPQEATSLHGIHKATAEQYMRLYARLYGLRVSIARVTNPFGPGQLAGRTAYGIVNRLIHLALENRTLAIYGDGRQQRDYVHVDDVVGALRCLASSEMEGGVFNVGSGTGTALIDVAGMIVDIAGSGRVEHVAWPQSAREVETGDFVADVSKIRRELGWRPQISLREGLERTVAAYRAATS
jgi:nucleoside-diphosphate-sugar epimerase